MNDLKPVATKNKFLKMLITLTILFMILIIGIGFYKINDIKKSTIASIINTSLKNLESEMAITIQNTHSQLKIVQEWGKNGILKLDKKNDLLNQFAPLLEQFKLIKSIFIVNEDGTTYLIKNNGNWLIYEYFPDKKAELTIFNSNKQKIAEKEIDSIIDFRKFNWYKNAKEDSYGFYYKDVQDTGNIATISIKWVNKKNKKLGVVAFEISSEFINQIYKKLDHEVGYAFLFEDTGEILHLVDKKSKNIESKILEKWKKNPNVSNTTFFIKINDTRWWVGIKRLKKNKRIMLSIAIPEKQILPDISKEKYKWYAAFSLILFSALLLIYFLLKAYSQSLEKINQLQNGNIIDEETKILNLIKAGENSKLEFKSTVRMNLKSGKIGKEIEKAWLKNVVAFLNTDGGTILLGVKDDGEIFGLEADNFKNKDSCMLHITNLIKQHIGLEFNNYISIECINIDGKEIVVIEIKEASEPAYLHMNDKEEEFFIRSGPSTVSLRISKAVKYIIKNKKININQK